MLDRLDDRRGRFDPQVVVAHRSKLEEQHKEQLCNLHRSRLVPERMASPSFSYLCTDQELLEKLRGHSVQPGKDSDVASKLNFAAFGSPQLTKSLGCCTGLQLFGAEAVQHIKKTCMAGSVLIVRLKAGNRRTGDSYAAEPRHVDKVFNEHAAEQPPISAKLTKAGLLLLVMTILEYLLQCDYM